MSRYVLVPDWVFSKHDGERHWISAPTLASLYGVPLGKCVIDDGLGGFRSAPDDVRLGPRYDGDYMLPKGEE